MVQWCLFLVLVLCVDEYVWKVSWLLIMNFIKESSCGHGTGGISNCLNSLLHEVLSYAPAIILTIFFCKVKIFPLLVELPQTFILYFTVEWKYALQIDLSVLMLLIWTIDLTAWHAALYLGIVCSIWSFQYMWLSVCKPINFVFTICSRHFSL